MLQAKAPENGLIRRYEELRSFALGENNRVDAPGGLALVLRCGVAPWILAWTLPAHNSLKAEKRSGTGDSPRGKLTSEVALVLANMALMSRGVEAL